MPPIKRNLISLNDLSDENIHQIVYRGLEYTNGTIKKEQLLNGLIIGIYFRKTSTRTRTSFSSASLRLGAQIISYGPNDLQENTGETIEDTAKVLSTMLDGIVARTAGPRKEMEILGSHNHMAVINAMSEDEHPTQALTDLITMLQHFGRISGLRILYLGEGNNTATALALSLSRFSGTELFLCTPPGYGIPKENMIKAQQYATLHSSFIYESHTLENFPKDFDIIYTTRWQTTGTQKSNPNWRDIFAPYKVSPQLLDKYPDALFMHDLPAHRGEEVDAVVLDGSKSIAFKQAGNKLHSACAILEWCLIPNNF